MACLVVFGCVYEKDMESSAEVVNHKHDFLLTSYAREQERERDGFSGHG